MSEDREAQEDELLALASIYDEEEFHRAEAAQGGEIQLCLELPAAFKVAVKGTPLWGHPSSSLGRARVRFLSVVLCCLYSPLPYLPGYITLS